MKKFRYCLLMILSLIFLFPLVWIGVTSFKTNIEVLSGLSILPVKFRFENYIKAWNSANFTRQFINSLIMAVGVCICQVITSILAGYAFSRINFKGKNIILMIILSSIIIPFQVLAIPVFIIVRTLGFLDTFWSLIIPSAANGFGIFLFKQFFDSIPIELEESAFIDGVPRRVVLWKVIMPLCLSPGIVLFIFTFIAEWNDLFKPLIFITSENMKTIQLGLSIFHEQFMTNYPLLMAGVIFSMVPTVILFIIGQKQFLQTITSSGIKG